jgi:hypothetical protein
MFLAAVNGMSSRLIISGKSFEASRVVGHPFARNRRANESRIDDFASGSITRIILLLS